MNCGVIVQYNDVFDALRNLSELKSGEITYVILRSAIRAERGRFREMALTLNNEPYPETRRVASWALN